MNEQDFDALHAALSDFDTQNIFTLYANEQMADDVLDPDDFPFDSPVWEDPEDGETLIISCAHVAEYYQRLGFDRNEFTPDGQFIVY